MRSESFYSFSGFCGSPSTLSLVAFLNSLIPLPSPFISSGIFLAPNNNSTTITINIICGVPIKREIAEYIIQLFIPSYAYPPLLPINSFVLTQD